VEAGSEEEEDERRGSIPNGSRRGSKLAEILKYQARPLLNISIVPSSALILTLAPYFRHILETNYTICFKARWRYSTNS
jgi:hypothetical protein